MIGIDTDQSATYDFLLVIHNNYGPVCLFPRTTAISVEKFAHFPTR